jgi:hypothetical protein
MAGTESARVLETLRVFTPDGNLLFSSTVEGQGTFDGGEEGPETGWWSYTVFRAGDEVVGIKVDRETEGLAYDRDIGSLEWSVEDSHVHTLGPLRASVEGRFDLADATISWDRVDDEPVLRVEADYDDGSEVKPHLIWFGSDGSLLRFVEVAETIDASDAEEAGYPLDALVELDTVVLAIGEPILGVAPPPLMGTALVPGRFVPFLVELPREGWGRFGPEDLEMLGYSLALGTEETSIGIIDIGPGMTLEEIEQERQLGWAALIGPGGGVFLGKGSAQTVTLQGEAGLTMTGTALLGNGTSVAIRELYVLGDDGAFGVSATTVDGENTEVQLLIDYVFQSVYLTDHAVADALRADWYTDTE